MSSTLMRDEDATVIRLDYQDLGIGSTAGATDSGRRGPPAPELLEEAASIDRATDCGPGVYNSLVLAAWRGQESRALVLVSAAIEDAPAELERRARALAEYAGAVLYNGLGRYSAALAAAERAGGYGELDLCAWALGELVEAGMRSGDRRAAENGLRRLEERGRSGASEWALGIQAQSAALLSEGEQADGFFAAAAGYFRTSRSSLHLARVQLLYGEWLRREGRRVDAREQLRAALEIFSRVGAEGFAERARRELLATGETVRRRTVETRDELTAQETQVARLAADGQTNPEIGAQLFLSPRTVEWHLHKVFRKLRVSSRKELRVVLAGAA